MFRCSYVQMFTHIYSCFQMFTHIQIFGLSDVQMFRFNFSISDALICVMCVASVFRCVHVQIYKWPYCRIFEFSDFQISDFVRFPWLRASNFRCINVQIFICSDVHAYIYIYIPTFRCSHIFKYSGVQMLICLGLIFQCQTI